MGNVTKLVLEMETEILLLRSENERLRKTLQQVLIDAQSQDVLFEWWGTIEMTLMNNEKSQLKKARKKVY